jgi:hypothetical protein
MEAELLKMLKQVTQMLDNKFGGREQVVDQLVKQAKALIEKAERTGKRT